MKISPRKWQLEAIQRWKDNHFKGILRVVTGGGKTFFAVFCIQEFFDEHPEGSVLIVVPTLVLLDQWVVCLTEDFSYAPEEISMFSGEHESSKPKRINIAVINTARDQPIKDWKCGPLFLIVDECHRAASPKNSAVLEGRFAATLGLSATPEREYDDRTEDVLIPYLGDIIFSYTYEQAHSDSIITNVEICNVFAKMLPHEIAQYDKLTKRIIITHKADLAEVVKKERLKRLLIKRMRVSAQARIRIPAAVKLVEMHNRSRAIIFHEFIESSDILLKSLRRRGHRATIYHSKLDPSLRRDNLRMFKQGQFDVLVTCRALDEGLNVPEATVAVIASSTSSTRQRIQRLGRVLRPSPGKSKATIFTIYCTDQERMRLENEEESFGDFATIKWLKLAK